MQCAYLVVIGSIRHLARPSNNDMTHGKAPIFIALVCSIDLLQSVICVGSFGTKCQHVPYFTKAYRLKLKDRAKRMFYFGYDNYMTYAFPKDELDPIHCTGRGPDYANPSNININDVLGDYSLGLIESLGTLAIMGNSTEFKRAVALVINTVSFDKNCTVQVFEATIRVMGGLLSAHMIIRDPHQPFGDMVPANYDDELLSMAHDLANRLLAAFDQSETGIPFPRVCLRDGIHSNSTTETCTAGGGSLLLEFGVLSRLLGDPTFENVARRAVKAIWKHRAPLTGLLGNVIDIQSGEWKGKMSGIGAGLDSFYEYLLKGYIMFGEPEDLRMFNEVYRNVQYFLRKGRLKCDEGDGDTPIYVNVNMDTGKTENGWVDSLQAFFAGLQVLKGDIREAVCSHAFFYAIWRKYKSLPERFSWHTKQPEVFFYPLRPELIESTYLLFQATRHPFYLRIGEEIMRDMESNAKARCGFATLHNVLDKSQEDRMESFFLSETTKYLYLLFDSENHVNRDASNYIFSTEGHLFKLEAHLRSRPWDSKASNFNLTMTTSTSYGRFNTSCGCEAFSCNTLGTLPLQQRYWDQIEDTVGLEADKR